MKIKSDFVTNSSSASFIMTFHTNHVIDQNRFESYINDLISYIEQLTYGDDKKYLPHFYNGIDIRRIKLDVYELVESTSMYNNYKDIPYFVREILVLSKIGILKDFGIKELEFRMEGHE